jgi:phosphate transport system permease protein
VRSVALPAATPDLRPVRNRWDRHLGDRVFQLGVTVAGLSVLLLLLAIGFFLAKGAWPAFEAFGFSFLTSTDWDPVNESFGALPVIFGTVVSSLLAMLIATPLSVGVALFLNELAPRRIARLVGFLVEMLAAIPSVVYGLWGIFVLAPWLRSTVEPALGHTLGFLPFFQGPAYGVGMLAAGLILAIMVTPTVSSICREVFRAIPVTQREAALALGATRWEAMRIAVLASAKSGIVGAVILGLGRAVGETMAVTMVIGNRSAISASLFAPAQTMASVLANEYAEASSDLHLAALIEVGFVLFLVTFFMNGIARLLVRRMTATAKGGAR